MVEDNRKEVTPRYRLLDLFSGIIGGFSLGLERSGGFKTVAFCEIEPFCRKVLKKHWPEVPQYDDVRTLTADRLAADGIGVDAICGGFPCQDISLAGKGAGLEGERSGLWFEYARIIGEFRPRFVFVENVAALLGRGLDRVLGDLASLGYDAEWHCIPASAVGAPHQRDRLWLVGYSHDESQSTRTQHDEASGLPGVVANADEQRTHGRRAQSPGGHEPADGGQNVAYAFRNNVQRLKPSRFDPEVWRGQVQRQIGSRSDGDGWWAVEPNVGRVAYGISNRAHRLRALGNAVVPQIPELLGRAILAAEGVS